jgi:hypothetical protein
MSRIDEPPLCELSTMRFVQEASDEQMAWFNDL